MAEVKFPKAEEALRTVQAAVAGLQQQREGLQAERTMLLARNNMLRGLPVNRADAKAFALGIIDKAAAEFPVAAGWSGFFDAIAHPAGGNRPKIAMEQLASGLTAKQREQRFQELDAAREAVDRSYRDGGLTREEREGRLIAIDAARIRVERPPHEARAKRALCLADIDAAMSGGFDEVNGIVTCGNSFFFGTSNQLGIQAAVLLAFFFGDSIKKRIEDHFDALYPGADPQGEEGSSIEARRVEIEANMQRLSELQRGLSEIDAQLDALKIRPASAA